MEQIPNFQIPPDAQSRSRFRQRATKQLQFALDITVLLGAFGLSYLLRFDFSVREETLKAWLIQLPLVALIQLMALVVAGVYSFVWRYIGMGEIKAFVRAASGAALLLVAFRFGLPEQLQEWRVPFSVIVMDTILAFGGVLALRVMRRAVYERHEKQKKPGSTTAKQKKVLLVGAGRAGVLAAKEIQGRGDMDLDVKGFVDDDPKKQGSVIHQVRVIGTTRDLPSLVRKL